MSDVVKVVAAISALAISQPAMACNSEALELPSDYAWANTVLVGKITNYRIVPNEAEGMRLTRAVNTGTAEEWQKKRFENRRSQGLPIGGSYGLFDVTVIDVLKGKSSQRITVIYPDVGEFRSRLPKSLQDRDVILGLEDKSTRTNNYYGHNLPILVVDYCTSAMLWPKNSQMINEARKHFGRSNRKR